MIEEPEALIKSLSDAKAEIERHITDSVSMYAVVDTGKPFYELMFISFKCGDNTDEFDRTLFSNGLDPYIQEDALSHIDEAIDDANKNAIIPLEWLYEEGDNSSKVSNLITQVSDLMHGKTKSINLGKEDIANVRGVVFVYCCGDKKIIAYQRTQNAWRAKSGLLFWNKGEFNLCTNESLKIGNSFDFLVYNNKLLVSKIGTLESQFGFKAVLQRKASGVISKLTTIMEDRNNYLSDKIENGDASVMKKLVKIDSLPIMSLIEENPNSLSEKAETIDEYRDSVRFENKKVIITHKKDIIPFLKMLNDQYLVSPLSGAKYESQNKRWIKSL